jgi:hypothetical protein
VKRVSIFLITVALIAGIAGCGDTTPSQNLEIRTWYDLDAVRNNLGGNHILMNDLDSTTAGYTELASPTANQGKGWQPIGSEYRLFAGSFDGQGYEIRDLFINRPDEWCVGLFSTVDEEGVIENIGVVNASVTGYDFVGGLAGFNDGTLSNSYSMGSVTGNSSVGGLTGTNWGTVSNSFYNYDEVLINGENIITIGALFLDDFEEWLANDKFLDVNERLSQENDYYVVNNVTDFKELLAFGQNTTLKFRLTNDLDLATEPDFYIPYLAGEFDGNEHKISNLSLDYDLVLSLGLFGYLAPGGKVTQVAAENVNVAGARFVGGLVGYNRGGTVSGSYSTGHVTGSVSGTGNERCFGGLVGYNVKGTVNNCHAAINVTGDLWAGGLVGLNDQGTVNNSYSTGSVNGHAEIGGLVGENYGTVSNSYSTADVTGEYSVGGLAGGNYGVVEVPGLAVEDFMGSLSNSYSTADVTGEYSVGGLAGGNYGAVGVPGLAVGGFMGSLSNSYSTGNVTGNEEVGGLVGLNDGGTVSNCYSTGSVSGNEDVGGLAGRNYGTVHDSFWDTKTSGQATSDGGTGRTTAQMKSITTFSDAGWNVIAVGGSDERDPAYIWNIDNGVTYPFLSWQPVQ